MSESAIRSLTVILAGLSLLVVAFLLIDVELTRRTIGLFVALPIGGVITASGIWAIVDRFTGE